MKLKMLTTCITLTLPMQLAAMQYYQLVAVQNDSPEPVTLEYTKPNETIPQDFPPQAHDLQKVNEQALHYIRLLFPHTSYRVVTTISMVDE